MNWHKLAQYFVLLKEASIDQVDYLKLKLDIENQLGREKEATQTYSELLDQGIDSGWSLDKLFKSVTNSFEKIKLAKNILKAAPERRNEIVDFIYSMRHKLGFQNGDILEILEMTYKDRKFDLKTIEGLINYHIASPRWQRILVKQISVQTFNAFVKYSNILYMRLIESGSFDRVTAAEYHEYIFNRFDADNKYKFISKIIKLEDKFNNLKHEFVEEIFMA